MAKTAAKTVAKTDTTNEQKAPTNTVLLKRIAAGTKTEQGFAYVGELEVVPLEEAGFVETNRATVNNEGEIAARITAAGLAELGQDEADAPKDQIVDPVSDVVDSAKAAENAAKTPKPKPVISGVASFALPEATKRGGARPETYPFSKLEVGQAFFIPATKEVPNPWNQFASTVASATNRYGVPSGEMKSNRKGEMVPVLKSTRVFQIRRIDDGRNFGEQFAGVPGAAVGRTQ